MWAQIINIIIGLSVMAAPAIVDFDKVAANNNHIVGPLIITFAVVSLWEINRNVRWFNIVAAAWLILSPFIVGFGGSARTIDIAGGIVVFLLSLYKGKIKHKYGGGWRSLFQKHPLHVQAVKSSSFK